MNRFGQWLTHRALKYCAPLDPPARALPDLPLVEVAARGPDADTLGVFLSGDGGWAVIDRAISHGLAGCGVPVVGFNSLRYFWGRRTPEAAAADLARILDHYLSAWRKERVLLVGYSRGANVLPFLLNRLPGEHRERVRLLVLLAPSRLEEFEVRVRDYFEDLLEHLHHWRLVGRHFDLPEAIKAAPMAGAVPVLPEVERVCGSRILCVHGEKEAQSLGPLLAPERARVVRRPGGHHFDRDYAAIARLILEELDAGICGGG